MKKFLLIVFIFPLSVGLTCDEEIPTKLYFMDKSYVTTWNFDESKDADMAIFIHNYLDIFNFKDKTNEYKIYFDRNFTQLAVNYKLIKENKQEHYQRYDRKGTLRMEYDRINGRYIGIFKAWYGNKNLKEIKYFGKNSEVIGDTIFERNRNIQSITAYHKDAIFKESIFYANGLISREVFYGSGELQSKSIFAITYDSITRKPQTYFVWDTIIKSISENGEEIITREFKYVPTDSVEIKRKK